MFSSIRMPKMFCCNKQPNLYRRLIMNKMKKMKKMKKMFKMKKMKKIWEMLILRQIWHRRPKFQSKIKVKIFKKLKKLKRL